MPSFMFATGIENSYPTIRMPDGTKKRIDQMEKCCHYKNWRLDFELVRDLGIQYLRYGPPYYKTHVGPGQYDWSFSDETFNTLKEMGITPIADLCHFGVPDWIGDFQNRDWPEYFAEYARAFATRYPWVRLYTPVNEIFIAALFSGQNGWWNECLTSDKGFVTALFNLSKANVLAMHAIADVNKHPTFIQSESSEYFHAEHPDVEDLALFLNQKRFLALDLVYGYQINVLMYEYLLDNGMSREEYHWFAKNHLRPLCIMGNDYYVTNEHLICEDGSICGAGEIFGYYVITKQYYDRYRLPVMHTETNTISENAVAWLRKEWANMHRLQLDGVPILGFTWYSLTDQMDWDVALREENNRVFTVGLYDLDRNIRPVGEAYKNLITQWRDILPTRSISLRAFF
jgi:beta-glucosidase/6-phospho-beta-glucosidase/beta-galactosidase